MNTMLIETDAAEFLNSLVSPWHLEEEGIREITHVSGAGLYKVAPEHYVILECIEHEGHRGAEYLSRIMPEGWVLFARGENPDEGYRAEHWGPA